MLDAVLRLGEGRAFITRQDLVQHELLRIEQETRSAGATPEQTLSRVLQELRDDGVLRFSSNGVYEILRRPVIAEDSDLAEKQLDQAVRQGLLRFGDIETGDTLRFGRQRKGQDQLRKLTLINYRNRCAVCDVKDTALLVTSHVRPWADDPLARGKLANAICLCEPHDSLFEHGYWSLSDDLRPIRKQPIRFWAVKALLPETLKFRRAEAPPDPAYLWTHRRKNGFE